jgi:hypothetical protein
VAQDRLHCGYCTNPYYGALLWKLVQECGLLERGRLEELARAAPGTVVSDPEIAT